MNYLYYIGIDISKDFFDIAIYGDEKNTMRFNNNKIGHNKFMKQFNTQLEKGLVVLEATGGYENNLLNSLCAKGIALHRANPLQAKNFVRSLGKLAKTDKIDAIALARYGYERGDLLSITKLPSAEQILLKSLLVRRADAVSMRVMERNRKKHPNYKDTLHFVEAIIKALDEQITLIDKEIEELVMKNEELAAKSKAMIKLKGIGKQTAYTIIALMPELGNLTRKQAASLAGVAPHPKDSGKTIGYRSTRGGRQQIKRALFMAAMSARNYNVELKKFYDNLINNGKKPIVAITAVMRKIITILNAIIRDFYLDYHHGR